MREIEELGDVPPRVVGDNATREQGIQEGDAAVLLRAYQLGRCVPVPVADGFEKPVDQVPEGRGYVRQGLAFMLAGHRDHIQEDIPQRRKADPECALHLGQVGRSCRARRVPVANARVRI